MLIEKNIIMKSSFSNCPK